MVHFASSLSFSSIPLPLSYLQVVWKRLEKVFVVDPEGLDEIYAQVFRRGFPLTALIYD